MSIDNHAAWLGEAHFCHFRHFCGTEKIKKISGTEKIIGANKRTNCLTLKNVESKTTF